MALVGHVDAISRAGVSGWVAAPTTIAVIVNGQERVAGPAADKGHGPDKTGFRFEFEPPLSVFQEWRIEVVEAASRAPLPGGVRTLPRPSRDGAATPAPIVVTSAGRSGTTLLMAEFARHPSIVVADRHPYEIKQIAYYASVFRTLAGTADRARSAHPDTMLLPERLHGAGSNPFNHPGFFDLATPRAVLASFYESRMPARLATTFRELILEFYDILRIGQGKAASVYFCEKGDLDEAARQAARLFFPRVRELLVVRDPRDLLASMIAFWKLTPAEGVRMLERAAPRLLDIHARQAPDMLTVRYEDLVLDPAASRRAIGKFLGIDVPADLPAPATPAMAAHRTSQDPAASVGRWRQDLSAEQVAACEAAFPDYMAAFDYRPGRGSAPAAAKPPAPAAPSPPAPAPRPAGLVVLAEGSAVGKLRRSGADEAVEGRPMQPLVQLEFGRGGAGAEHLGPGWSNPELGHVWSNAHECRVTLPMPRQPGRYRVWLAGLPMLHAEKLPQQSITILADTTEIGTAVLRALSVLAFDLPAAKGEAISLTLRLPDAARPRALGGSTDERLLGLSLRWATIFRTDPAPAAQPPAG